MTVSKLDKIYYNMFIKQHDLAREHIVDGRGDELFDLIDYFYKGGLDTNHGKDIQAMDEVNAIRAMVPVCRNNAWRAVDTAANVLEQGKPDTDNVDEDNEADFKASVQNFYSSDKVVDAMQEAKDSQDMLDMMVGASNEAGLSTEPGPDEIEFRNWLSERVKYDHNLKEILEWFGNFYSFANELKRKNYEHSSTVERIVTGNHVPDIVPSEFALCGIEELDVLFDYSFVMKDLMQFDRTSISEGKGGPITLGLDLSASMGDPIGGQKKFNIAAGFAMAVVKVMDDDDRRCQMFGFRWQGELLFNGDEPLAERLKRIVKLDPSGGTLLQAALLYAFDIAPKDDDVLIVTDGADENIDVDRVNNYKGERKVSTLLVSHLSPKVMKMKAVSDSFIIANDSSGFEQLMSKAIG